MDEESIFSAKYGNLHCMSGKEQTCMAQGQRLSCLHCSFMQDCFLSHKLELLVYVIVQ